MFPFTFSSKFETLPQPNLKLFCRAWYLGRENLNNYAVHSPLWCMSELWRKLENEKVTQLAINFMQNYGMDKVHTRQNCKVSSYKNRINRGLVFPRTRAVWLLVTDANLFLVRYSKSCREPQWQYSPKYPIMHSANLHKEPKKFGSNIRKMSLSFEIKLTNSVSW